MCTEQPVARRCVEPRRNGNLHLSSRPPAPRRRRRPPPAPRLAGVAEQQLCTGRARQWLADVAFTRLRLRRRPQQAAQAPPWQAAQVPAVHPSVRASDASAVTAVRATVCPADASAVTALRATIRPRPADASALTAVRATIRPRPPDASALTALRATIRLRPADASAVTAVRTPDATAADSALRPTDASAITTTVRATLRPPDASAITTLRATVRSADAAGGADVPDRHAEAERVRGRAERADPPGDRAGGQVQVLPAGAGGGGPGRGAVPLHHHPRAPAQHQHLPPHRAQPAHHLRQARAVGLPVPAALRLMSTTTSQHFYTRRHACMM